MSATNKAKTGAFSLTTMLALVLIGIVCMAGLALISSFEPELKSGDNGGGHALSKSSVGYLALTRIIKDTGVDINLDRLGRHSEDDTSTVVLMPSLSVDSDQIEKFDRDGATVIILPKWLVAPDQKKKGWAKLFAPVDKDDALAILPADLIAATDIIQLPGSTSVTLTYTSVVSEDTETFGVSKSINSLRAIKGPKWEPIVAGPNETAVIAKHKDKNIYVVADADLANNAAMSNIANARLFERFLYDISEYDEPVVFDLTLNGFQRQPNLGRLLLRPPMLGATLCLVLASILIGIQAAVRFLPPREMARVIALGKRALADNTAALIRMGRREHRMAVPYANMVKRQVLKAISAPSNLDTNAQAPMLDRVSELSNSQLRYSNLVGEAGSVSTPEGLVKVAKDIQRWKQETTRERQ